METVSFSGLRLQRYAMVIENYVVTHSYVEAAKEFEASKAESLLDVF